MTAPVNKDASFYLESSPGHMDNPPAAKLIFANDYVIAYSLGRDMFDGQNDSYTGIGKYKISLSDIMLSDLKKMENGLINPKPNNVAYDAGLRLGFNFSKGHDIYSGEYAYDSEIPTDSYNKIVQPFYDIYQKTVTEGEPLISFYPSIAITQASHGFLAKLTFHNNGKEPITLGGPSTWSSRLSLLPSPRIRVEGWTTLEGVKQNGFYFMLTDKTLVSDKHLNKEVLIPAGSCVTLVFDIPYSNIVFYSHDNRASLASGKYTFAGDIWNIDILAPNEMKGRATTPIDSINNVSLHSPD